MKNIVEIKNLSKTYHSISGEVLSIKKLSLNVKEGEFVSILGPSGCGKSTILNILAGLDKDYEGNIKFQKDNIILGYMLQDDSLFDWLTVFDNAVLGLKIQKKMTRENITYVKDLLNKYGLKDFLDKYPVSLSGGMRQRVV